MMGGEPEEEQSFIRMIEARFRGWHVWRGLNGLWYPWRRKTSPPRITRHPTREDLVAELRQREAQQDRWDTGD